MIRVDSDCWVVRAWMLEEIKRGPQRDVLTVLLEHADDRGRARIGQAFLMEATGHGRTAVQRAIAELAEEGYVRRVRRTHRRARAEYVLRVPPSDMRGALVVPGWARAITHPNAERDVLAALLRAADDEGGCTMRVRSVNETIGWGLTPIRKALSALQERGVLERVDRPGRPSRFQLAGEALDRFLAQKVCPEAREAMGGEHDESLGNSESPSTGGGFEAREAMGFDALEAMGGGRPHRFPSLTPSPREPHPIASRASIEIPGKRSQVEIPGGGSVRAGARTGARVDAREAGPPPGSDPETSSTRAPSSAELPRPPAPGPTPDPDPDPGPQTAWEAQQLPAPPAAKPEHAEEPPPDPLAPVELFAALGAAWEATTGQPHDQLRGKHALRRAAPRLRQVVDELRRPQPGASPAALRMRFDAEAVAFVEATSERADAVRSPVGLFAKVLLEGRTWRERKRASRGGTVAPPRPPSAFGEEDPDIDAIFARAGAAGAANGGPPTSGAALYRRLGELWASELGAVLPGMLTARIERDAAEALAKLGSPAEAEAELAAYVAWVKDQPAAPGRPWLRFLDEVGGWRTREARAAKRRAAREREERSATGVPDSRETEAALVRAGVLAPLEARTDPDWRRRAELRERVQAHGCETQAEVDAVVDVLLEAPDRPVAEVLAEVRPRIAAEAELGARRLLDALGPASPACGGRGAVDGFASAAELVGAPAPPRWTAEELLEAFAAELEKRVDGRPMLRGAAVGQARELAQRNDAETLAAEVAAFGEWVAGRRNPPEARLWATFVDGAGSWRERSTGAEAGAARVSSPEAFGAEDDELEEILDDVAEFAACWSADDEEALPGPAAGRAAHPDVAPHGQAGERMGPNELRERFAAEVERRAGWRPILRGRPLRDAERLVGLHDAAALRREVDAFGAWLESRPESQRYTGGHGRVWSTFVSDCGRWVTRAETSLALAELEAGGTGSEGSPGPRPAASSPCHDDGADGGCPAGRTMA